MDYAKRAKRSQETLHTKRVPVKVPASCVGIKAMNKSCTIIDLFQVNYGLVNYTKPEVSV